MEGLLSTGPTPSSFYHDQTEEQYFIATLMMANLEQKKEMEFKP